MVGAIHQGYGRIRNMSNKPKIYGVKRLLSDNNPKWERTDNAVGLTATASIGTETVGYSDFNNIMPWKGMVRETLSTGDVMVYIPTFWYQRWQADGYEYIRISPKKQSKFSKHPGSNRYFGAYLTSTDNMSKSGTKIRVSKYAYQVENLARDKGKGWHEIDIHILSAIQMLFIVEFATNNSQETVGKGWTTGSASSNISDIVLNGTCDNVANLTGRASGTDGKTVVVYRGIESLWGTIVKDINGLNISPTKYYICTDPDKYEYDTTTNYDALSYVMPTGYPYRTITQMGYDERYPWIMLPSVVESDTYNDYTKGYCDFSFSKYGANNRWYYNTQGGTWYNGDGSGLFCGFYLGGAKDDASTNHHGSCLMYIPE